MHIAPDDAMPDAEMTEALAWAQASWMQAAQEPEAEGPEDAATGQEQHAVLTSEEASASGVGGHEHFQHAIHLLTWSTPFFCTAVTVPQLAYEQSVRCACSRVRVQLRVSVLMSFFFI